MRAIVWYCCAVIWGSATPLSLALYADQAGQFDWLQRYVGLVSKATYDDKRTYVMTESNVIASLKAKTGEIQWRQVLPEGDRVNDIGLCGGGVVSVSGGRFIRGWSANEGKLQWEHVRASGDGLARVAAISDNEALAVSGNEVSLVNCRTGDIKRSTTLGTDKGVTEEMVFEKGTEKVRFLSREGRIVRVFSLDLATWEKKEETYFSNSRDQSLPTTYLKSSKGSSGPFLIQLAKDGTLDVVTLQTGKSYSYGLSSFTDSKASPQQLLFPAPSQHNTVGAFVVVDEEQNAHLACLNDGGVPQHIKTEKGVETAAVGAATLETEGTSLTGQARDFGTSWFFDLPYGLCSSGSIVSNKAGRIETPGCFCISLSSERRMMPVTLLSSLQLFNATDGKEFIVFAYKSTKGSFVLELIAMDSLTIVQTWNIKDGLSDTVGLLNVFAQVFTRKGDGSIAFRALVLERDHRTIAVEKSKLMWTRDESLASIAKVEWIGLSEHVEEETFVHIPPFTERLKVQLHHLQSLGRKLLDPSSFTTAFTDNKHYFGFDKVIVAYTSTGKLFGIEASTGSILYREQYPPHLQLVPRRRMPGGGEVAELFLLSSSSLFVINGETGKATKKISLGQDCDQVLLFPPHAPSAGMEGYIEKILLLVQEGGRVELFPDTDSSRLLIDEHIRSRSGLGEIMYFHKVDRAAKRVVGYAIKSVRKELRAIETWTVAFDSSEKVIATSSRADEEVVDSPVMVLGDDSLLIKYLNPHMIAVATLSEGERGGSTEVQGAKHNRRLTLHILDSVTGRILHRVSHVNGAEPCTIAQTENWFVYSFFNPATSRTEVASVSLYEGMIGKRSLSPWRSPKVDHTFSSFNSSVPVVLQKTFAFPTGIKCMAPTITAKGITTKSLLVGLSTGQILSMDRRLVDPRRPIGDPSEDDQSEGLLKYSIYVPMIPTAVVTYNQTIEGLRGIKATGAKLESSSLVFAYGLDLFFTRVNPSKTFDLLSSDFNYPLLVALTAGLFIAQLIGKHMVQQKKLKTAWK